MKVAGEKIKIARKQKKLSQAELAKGICTQATISNIENKNVCDSLDIFSSVCLRLDLQVEECIEGSNEKKLESLLNKVEHLCDTFRHEEAYELLNECPDEIDTTNRILETKFFYYKGITSLLGKKNTNEALFYLHRGSEIDKDINIYNILSVNSIGILYELEDDLEKAKVYYDKSLQLLNDFKQDFPLEQCRIYYNTAKFYSLIKDYEKSIELSQKGIDINRVHHTTYVLDCLLYETAFNKHMLGSDAAEDYRIAYYFTRFFRNENILSYVEKDMKNFGITY
ncbi:helix-turn-helix domain-containing protein [Melissococcus plutonius]|uniref:Transcriptional regulator, Cro/CI family n=2 Tax=Melissococcus plutonius TaxID=33970 RepID=F3YB58_MELPT|nr:helix-turn-helix domain-containing protein [Melissococcus plutonius]BAL61915.1 Cro/CI family transcriptional regulator [Melissococcus plutonius DAT561]AIM25160.1 Cro/CI family transcriptional regulator [Melissococcus plutonius S1]KMT25416.1 Cro/CI family transcriptional regulator [Melissococcus plutonius]KMT25456.1 Cro/CI family transcriptional regulator [Melissococcus plutonius]KMT26320.1 Cro/CI family transcriptional regulator [Melissococcus plutonius]